MCFNKITSKVKALKKYLSNIGIVTALVAYLASWTIVHADEPPIPHDYTQEVGGTYIFVMLSTLDPSAYAGNTRDENIRSHYNVSGLYSKSDSLTPIWTVDWYAFRVNISSDGKYLVRWGDWPIIHDYDALALEFYENGRVIKSYAVKDLVMSPSLLPETVSHYEWEETSSFDAEQEVLWLKTLNKEEYTFNLTTGEVIKRFLPPAEVSSFQIIIIVCGVLTVFAGLVFFRRLKG